MDDIYGRLVKSHTESILKLYGVVLTNDWGKLGWTSEVARLKVGMDVVGRIDPAVPYAQCLAERLHKQKPQLYKDDNHKPEIAIALTPFSGFCGFRPVAAIARFLKTINELQRAVGQEEAESVILTAASENTLKSLQSMKRCFSSLVHPANRERVVAALADLVTRIKDMDPQGEQARWYEKSVVLKLNQEYPGDPGIFAVYFLNVVNLEVGEALFVDVNVPHAYLSGDCVECMANSDNVLRAAFSSKQLEINTLCESVDYTSKPASQMKLMPTTSMLGDCVFVDVYQPSLPEFGVTRYKITQGGTTVNMPAMSSASICIVTQGKGRIFLGDTASFITPQDGACPIFHNGQSKHLSDEKEDVSENGFSNHADNSRSGNDDVVGHFLELTKGTTIFIGAHKSVVIEIDEAETMLFRAHAGVGLH